VSHEVELTLPFPPSINRYWRNNRGRTHISTEGRKYKEQVGWLCKERGLRPFNGDVSVRIWVTPPDRRRRDLDNLQKCLLDALQGYCYHDDSQIVHLAIAWSKNKPGARVIVMEKEQQAEAEHAARTAGVWNEG